MKDRLNSEQLKLIEESNLENEEENLQREKLLFGTYGRSAILNHVPTTINWHKVEIEREDLDKLYILMIWDWFVDTERTFKLSEVPSNLSSGHGHKISNFPPGAADHKAKIDEMSHVMNNTVQDIIMISASERGPFTIIDGTHRSSLLAVRGQVSGIRAYLGIAKDLSKCVWTPEWDNYQQSLIELNQLVDGGFLW